MTQQAGEVLKEGIISRNLNFERSPKAATQPTKIRVVFSEEGEEKGGPEITEMSRDERMCSEAHEQIVDDIAEVEAAAFAKHPLMQSFDCARKASMQTVQPAVSV